MSCGLPAALLLSISCCRPMIGTRMPSIDAEQRGQHVAEVGIQHLVLLETPTHRAPVATSSPGAQALSRGSNRYPPVALRA
jgi:hypothetical protein